MNGIVKRALLENDISENDITEYEKLFDFSSLEFTFFDLIENNQENLINNGTYENLRYYYLHINRTSYKLEIPFIHICKHKDELSEIGILEPYRLKDCRYNEEMYFYYFFIMTEQIYSICDKITLMINDIFQLKQNSKDNNFAIKVKNALLKNSELNTIKEVKVLSDYLSNYENTIFHKKREEFRNNPIHNVSEELPKLIIINSEIEFEKKLEINTTFNDLIELLQSLNEFFKIVNKSIATYINTNN